MQGRSRRTILSNFFNLDVEILGVHTYVLCVTPKGSFDIKKRLNPKLMKIPNRVLKKAMLLISSVAAAYWPSTQAFCQWTGAAANSIYNDPTNWTGGNINGVFSTTAPGASLLFNNDATTSINFSTGTTITTTLSGSGATRTILLDGDLKGTSGTSNVTIANSLTLNLNGSMRSIGDTAGSGSWTVGANVIGTGGLTFAGGTNTSKLTITGTTDNTYTGGTVVSNGILAVDSALGVNRNLLGTGSMTVASGATLQMENSQSTFAGTTYLSGAGEVGTNGALVGAKGYGYASFAGPIVLNANSTIGIQQTYTNNLFIVNGPVNLGTNTLTLNPATSLINFGLRMNGVISGSGGITQSVSGFSRLAGANTYTGATIVTAGTLQANVATVGGVNPTSGAFGVNSAVTVGTGAAIDLNGFNQTFGSLAGSGTVTGKVEAGSQAPTLIIGTDNSSTNFSGIIQNGALTGTGLSINKSGGGTLSLSGTNTYTGSTAVNAGTLIIGTGASGSVVSQISLNNGALYGDRVSGNNTTGFVTIGNGAGTADAIFSAGNGAGAIGRFASTSGLTFNSDASFVFELNSSTMNTDRVTSGGVITLNGVFSLIDLNSGTSGWNPNDSITVINGSSLSGVFSNLANGQIITVNSVQYQASYSATALNLTVVPEPRTAFLIVVGGVAALFFRRRRAC